LYFASTFGSPPLVTLLVVARQSQAVTHFRPPRVVTAKLLIGTAIFRANIPDGRATGKLTSSELFVGDRQGSIPFVIQVVSDLHSSQIRNFRLTSLLKMNK
jgi:hypothetical protein